MKPFTRRDDELWLKCQQTDDKEAVEVEAEMKIDQTLKREFVLKTVEVELKAIKVSQ